MSFPIVWTSTGRPTCVASFTRRLLPGTSTDVTSSLAKVDETRRIPRAGQKGLRWIMSSGDATARPNQIGQWDRRSFFVVCPALIGLGRRATTKNDGLPHYLLAGSHCNL